MKANLLNVHAKLGWADTQINALEAQIRSFLQRKPYRIREKPKPKFVSEPNPAQAEMFKKGRFFELVFTERLPASIPTTAGMVIQAQRDSLDYLAYALAVKNGAVEPADVYFVISDSEEGFTDKRARRKLSKLSAEDRRVIEALKPYKGGNDLLHSLHWLNNKSKHRSLMTIAAAEERLHFTGHGWITRFLILPVGNTLCPNEPLICLEASEGIQLDLTVTIAFREIGYPDGKPVVEMLREFSRLTSSIVCLFE